MRSPATCAARLESDWLSATLMVTGCFLPSPQTRPSPMCFSPAVGAVLVGDAERGKGTGERGHEAQLDLGARLRAGADRGGRARRGRGHARGCGGRARRLVVVVSSVPPQAASRPPSPAPTPMVAPAMPAIFRKSRRLTVLPLSKAGSSCSLASRSNHLTSVHPHVRFIEPRTRGRRSMPLNCRTFDTPEPARSAILLSVGPEPCAPLLMIVARGGYG